MTEAEIEKLKKRLANAEEEARRANQQLNEMITENLALKAKFDRESTLNMHLQKKLNHSK
jgi:hypothetical protein